MKILNRYIGSSVIGTIMLVIFVLVGMEIFIGFSNQFTDVGTGNYGIFHATAVVLMLLPVNLYQFFPMAGLIGTLMGLGALASRSELIVMRAAGVSIMQITWAVIKAALIVLVLAVIVGEVIGPLARHEATRFKADAMSKGQAIYTRRGIWLRNGRDFIHIGTINPKGSLANITRYQFNKDATLSTASMAKTADFEHGRWSFKNVVVSQFGKGQVVSSNVTTQDWGLRFKPRILGLVNIESSERSLPQLHSYISYLKRSGLRSIQYRIDFWQRIFQPFSVLAMILLAIPFIFGPLRSATMGLRIVAGTVVGFIFYFINQFIGPLSTVYMLPPIAVAVIPTLLVLVFGYFLLLRIK